MYVECKFLDEQGNAKGRDYTYATPEDVVVGEIMTTPEGKRLVVVSEAKEKEALSFGAALKTIMPDTKQNLTVIDSPPELAVNVNELVEVRQLPVIGNANKLKYLSAEINNHISTVLAMPCTMETKGIIKKERASLNSMYKEFEDRRIAVKKQVLAPYEAFEVLYRQVVTEPFKRAFKQLDEQTNLFDDEIKSKMNDEVQAYFYEYANSQNVGFLKWEQSRITVGLSSNMTALRRETTEFIDRIKTDIDVIETQDDKAEILVEYHKTLSATTAIKAVSDRKKAVELQKELEKEREEKLKQRLLEQESKPRQQPVAPKPLEAPKPVVAEAPKQAEREWTVTFSVTGSTKQIKEVVVFMNGNGCKWEQLKEENNQ